MTSQKSLKNNVNLNDFKRSLTGSLLFPTIALLVIFFFATISVMDFFYGSNRDKTGEYEWVYMFFNTSSMFYSSFETLQVGMVFCGMMTAAKSFYFLLSKKQVNVYLSLGVTRTRMFLNRLSAAAITLFTSVFVPFTITYLINIAELGATSQLTDVYLYMVFSLFIASMVGFAISSLAMMVSGNIFESVVTMGTISFLPPIAVTVFNFSKEVMLKGFVYNHYEINNAIFFNPFGFINNSQKNIHLRNFDDSEYLNINQVVMNFSKSQLVNNEIPKEYAIDWGFIRPVVIWFVVGIVLTALALLLFNKRKAENSNSLGKFAVSRTINGAFAMFVVWMFCVGVFWYEIGTIGVTLSAIGLSIIVYFIIQLILTRKIKTAFKSLSACAIILVAFVGMIGFIETGYFGTYNKLPEKDNIKAVSITIPEAVAYNHPYPGGEYIISTNSDDISMVVKLFDEVKKDDGDYAFSIVNAFFEFETKDGKIISREFGIYSPELYNKYTEAIINSNFFDGVLEYEFLGFDENNKSNNGEYTFIKNDRMMSSEPNRVATVNFYDSQLLVPYELVEEDKTESIEGEYYDEYVPVEDTDREFIINKGDDFATALYNDLSKMTYNELCKNNSQPLGVLGWIEDDVCKAEDIVIPTKTTDTDMFYQGGMVKLESGIKEVYAWVSIYPEMTETVAYLNDNHIDFTSIFDVPIKQVLYTDSNLMFNEATKEFMKQVVSVQGENKHYEHYFRVNRVPTVSFSTSMALIDDSFYNLRWYISDSITQEELLKKVYADIGHPLKIVEENDISNVLSSSVGQYDNYNDNGRVVYIIYEDGSMIAKYLPEANIGVLK